jgi:hypothetical protein
MSSGKSEQKAYSAPWGGQQPYLQSIYRRAEGLYGDQLQLYPGQMYPEEDPLTVHSRQGMGQLGMSLGESGTPLMRTATEQMQKTAAGQYLQDNPYLDQTFRRASRSLGTKYADIVGGGIAGRFGSSGRTGSPAEMRALRGAQTELGGTLENLASDIYGKAYETERGRQFQAASMAPGVANAAMGERMAGYGAAESAGLARESREQTELDELIRRFDWAQQEPYERLTRYAGLIGSPITSERSKGSSAQGLLSYF